MADGSQGCCGNRGGRSREVRNRTAGDRPRSPSDGVTKERVMIGYISIEEQVDADFSRALRRAFVRQMGARLRGGGPGASRSLP